ncbi:UNVERIFIED_CONTAM: hypothetical protein HDU68_006283 [Siphonaria sp. JEL0065]|nr:hypothetical protein HDU68_006283 [Siphonaria sp. JEL0065]
MPCCDAAKWQREDYPDHKFDYIDLEDHINDNWTSKLKYSFIFFLTLKSVLVYAADVALLTFLIIGGALDPNFKCPLIDVTTSTGFAANATESISAITGVICNPYDSNSVSHTIAPTVARPWIMLTSVILSFLLLLWDYRKGYTVIQSRDIARSLTNHVAYRYYSLKSYPHYCFFGEILDARTGWDKVAFFVYFTFKSWRRLFLAEFPRVYVNALNLYDILHVKILPADKWSNPIVQFYNAFVALLGQRLSDPTGFATLLLTVFSLTMWFISFVAIVIAFFMYFPLLYKIRGNLKEYVCHKIDKRISELLKRKVRERTQEARQAELRDLEVNRQLQARNLAQGGGEGEAYPIVAAPLGMKARPTLPNVGDIDLDSDSYSGSYPEGSIREGSIGAYQPYYVQPPDQVYQGAGYGVAPPNQGYPPQQQYQQQPQQYYQPSIHPSILSGPLYNSEYQPHQQPQGYQQYQQPGPPPPPNGPPPQATHSGYAGSNRPPPNSPLSLKGDGRAGSGEPLFR